MAGNALINIKFASNLKQFSTQMQNANRGIAKMGKKLQSVGAALSIGVTAPILGLGKLALDTASNFEQLEGRLTTAFKGSEDAAKSAFDTIIGFTSKTPFQVEQVADAFIKLKNLGLEPSESALTSYGNTAAAMGKSLNQLIEAVADASTGEFERLKEFGIKSKSEGDNVSFTFQGVTKTVGKNAAEITAYLQDIGNVNFAGAMDAQAQTFEGRISNLKDSLALLGNEIGSIILEYVKPFVETLRNVVVRFRELSPQTKKFIVILGGVAAAIGPLLALAGTILPAIATGFTVLSGPIGLVVAGLVAIGTVIYKNWAPIKQSLVDIANYFIDLYNESALFRGSVEFVILTFKNLFEIGKFALNGIWSILKGLASAFVDNFKFIGKIIKAVFTGNFGEIKNIVSEFQNSTKVSFADTVANLGEDWQNLTEGLKQNTADAFDAINQRAKIKVKIETAGNVADVTTNPLAPKPTTSGGAATKPKAKTVGDGLQMVGLNIIAPLQEEAEKLDFTLNSMKQKFVDFSEQTSTIVSQAATSVLAGFGEMIGGLLSGNVALGDVAGGLLRTIGQLATQLGKAAIEIGVGMLAIKAAFANPLSAIAAGIALVAIGTLISSAANITSGQNQQNFAGSFAEGGIVGGSSFTGDRLFARVNSGEMILNKRQQNNLAGMLNPAAVPVNVTLMPSVDIVGDKFRVLLNRVDKRNSRLGYEG